METMKKTYGIKNECMNCRYFTKIRDTEFGNCAKGMWKKVLLKVSPIVEKKECSEIERTIIINGIEINRTADIKDISTCFKFKFNLDYKEEFRPKEYNLTIEKISRILQVSGTCLRNYLSKVDYIKRVEDIPNEKGMFNLGKKRYIYDINDIRKMLVDLNKLEKIILLDNYIKNDREEFEKYILEIS